MNDGRDDIQSMLPSGSFELLSDSSIDKGPGLPQALRDVYAGDWRVTPDDLGRPYVYVNFCVSRDGRVSFSDPGSEGGSAVSDCEVRDQWIMGLLRARADAVLVGDSTLRLEREHLWTSDYICPADAAVFAAVRRAEGRAPAPLQVFLSLSGDLPADAAVFTRPDLHVIVATTSAGARVARRHTLPAGRLDVLELGEEMVDVAALAELLYHRYEVRTLLCEGGPRVYGSVLAAIRPLDEFVTLAPIVIGDSEDGPRRPALVEGVRFPPADAPRSRLLSVRRGADYLFLHSRYDR